MKQRGKLFVLFLISAQILKPISCFTVAKSIAGASALIWYVKRYNVSYNSKVALENAAQEQVDRLTNHISKQSLEILRLKENNKQWQEYGQRMLEYARSLELQIQSQKKMSL